MLKQIEGDAIVFGMVRNRVQYDDDAFLTLLDRVRDYASDNSGTYYPLQDGALSLLFQDIDVAKQRINTLAGKGKEKAIDLQNALKKRGRIERAV